MKAEKSNIWKRLAGSQKLLLAALGLGVLLLVIPWGSGDRAQTAEQAPVFDLEAEETRIAKALGKLEGAGAVTVVLTLESSAYRELARNVEGARQDESGGGGKAEERSQVAEVSNAALTVKYDYPRYRGALVVISGGGSAVKLEVTQAVAALTGLSTDKITVVKGAS